MIPENEELPELGESALESMAVDVQLVRVGRRVTEVKSMIRERNMIGKGT